MKGNITVTEPDNAKRNKNVAFKNNAPLSTAIQRSRQVLQEILIILVLVKLDMMQQSR